MSALSAQIIVTADGIKRREAIPRVILVTSPAAGADWSVLVPGGVVWRVMSIFAQYLASAVVANRVPNITLSDGSNVYARMPAPGFVAASNNAKLGWYKNYGATNSNSPTAGLIAPFPDFPVWGGSSVSSLTVNVDVGDQWSAIVLYVIEIWERSPSVEEQYELARVMSASGNAYLDLEDNY